MYVHDFDRRQCNKCVGSLRSEQKLVWPASFVSTVYLINKWLLL